MRVRQLDLTWLNWQLFDPRGRCNRQGFLVVAIAIVAVQLVLGTALYVFGMPVDGALFWLLNVPLLWAGTTVAIKRMHDIGLPAWWIPVAFVGWMLGSVIINTIVMLIAGPERMAAAVAGQSLMYWVLFVATALPAFGGLLWLHASAGEPSPNKYGAVPGSNGFSGVARPPHAAPAPSGAVATA